MSSKTVDLGPDLKLPVDIASEACAFLGRRGGGKTYAAGKAAESYLAAGVQIGIIDQVGKWYGLRLAADGKTPMNEDLVILGGLRGDVPLAAESGALCAELFASSGRPMVFDVSQFSKGARKRWCWQFGEKLWSLAKAERDPVVRKIILEEAHLVVPQMIRPDDAQMYGTWEEIVRLGRNHGFGVDLICQRPQSVNKEVLSQVEIVFAFQMSGKTDRKEMQEWIAEKGGDADLVKELPKLKKGDCYVWSPQLLERFDRVRFGEKKTYDSSATPKVGQKRVDRDVKPIDLGDLTEKMAAVKEQAEKSDPRLLQKRIAELERELAKAPAAKPSPSPAPPKVKKVEVQVLNEKLVARLERALDQWREQSAHLHKTGQDLESSLGAAKRALMSQAVLTVRSPRPEERARFDKEVKEFEIEHGDLVAIDGAGRMRRAPPRPPHSSVERPRPVREPRARADENDGLKRGAREMLSALAQMHPQALTRHQVATWVGLPAGGSTFGTYLSQLKRGALVEEGSAGLRPTEAGLEYAGDVPPPPSSTGELLALWGGKLKAGARTMLELLVDAHPKELSREDLGERVGLPHTGSTFGTYLSILRRNGLVEVDRGSVRASDTLFLRGAA